MPFLSPWGPVCSVAGQIQITVHIIHDHKECDFQSQNALEIVCWQGPPRPYELPQTPWERSTGRGRGINLRKGREEEGGRLGRKGIRLDTGSPALLISHFRP